ncbi:hypothetical protein [Microbacterium immunditiarum]|uniref:Uncharacterized protein n=1 Tax=Microbacterium immunditiarum TaxID=337480 RepID=A0A7Y9GK69_9MICO|nr:hypothetical protein [Microbacterium immunditiarum]NYE18046.1 hypothetical protein [Microbacterium immunditiarum]
MSMSAWRANDVVAYDAMREAANSVVALVLRRAAEGAIEQSAAGTEAASIRRDVFQVDGYDRAAVDALRDCLDARAAELSGNST